MQQAFKLGLTITTHLVEKGSLIWIEPSAKGQNFIFEPVEVTLLNDFMRFTLLSDETHEYSFLQRTQTFNNVKHMPCTQTNTEMKPNMLKLTSEQFLV